MATNDRVANRVLLTKSRERTPLILHHDHTEVVAAFYVYALALVVLALVWLV
jgi:hypothetical protein